MGANVQPQGLAVQPSLAAVMPMGANVQPQGLNVAPTDTMKMTAGKIVNPIRTSYQPSQEMVMDIGADLTPGGSRHAGHGRKLAADAAAGDTAASSSSPSRGKLTIADDPLDLSNEMPNDYRNWASLLSQILLTKEGDSNAGEGAKGALAGLIMGVRGRLARVADGEPLLPRFHLAEPLLQAAMDGMDHSSHGGMGGMAGMHMHKNEGVCDWGRGRSWWGGEIKKRERENRARRHADPFFPRPFPLRQGHAASAYDQQSLHQLSAVRAA